MALLAGTKLGPYEVLSPLGVGGMGEVYRARDQRLERDVAIKVLPASLAADASLRQRLEREAKAVSKLSHPHICTLHDIGHQDGVDFLVMELLEGETLEQRLLRGPLPMPQALRIAIDIADALAGAHRLGIMHRDLKPSNVMLTKNGAKLMDFGLAKQSGPAPLAAALTEMTLDQPKLTTEGMLVGTFQYMAPEQLEGKEADARTDIFAFGELLYEMVTGKPAFNAKSRASLIAAILTTEPPPITQVQPLTPPALERVVAKCLAKEPDERWQSASDLASELKWIAGGASSSGAQQPMIAAAPARPRVGAWAGWTAAVLAAIVATVFLVLFLHSINKKSPVVRAQIAMEEGTLPLITGDFAGPPVVSPDGAMVSYVAARQDGTVLLWVRALNSLHARALPGTESASLQFWSPDSRSLGYFAGGKLKTVSIEGGAPTEVCAAPIGRGGSWNQDGTIIFAPNFQATIFKVAATGGTPIAVTVMDKTRHDSHRWPVFLPDGKHFLYLAATHANAKDENIGIYFASLDGKETHRVLPSQTNVSFADGYLLFVRDNVLMAQPFDPASGVLRGEARRVAEDVLVDLTTWRAQFDANRSVLAYFAGGPTPWQPIWFDRSGKLLGPAGDKATNLGSIRLSPDGTRLASEAGESETAVWVFDYRRKVNTRLTFGSFQANSPIWSPDGQWIAYAGVRSHNGLFRKPSNGMGQEETLWEGDASTRYPQDWSPDGQTIIFAVGDLSSTGRLWALSVHGDRKAVPLTPDSYAILNARFSPDGRWIVYSSTETGKPEVYVMPFGEGTGKQQISSEGGMQPVWRHDGKEIFYWSTDNTLIATPITVKPGEVEVGTPQKLFRPNNYIGTVGALGPYDVSSDGQRIVLITTPEQAARPITLVTNWNTDLQH